MWEKFKFIYGCVCILTSLWGLFQPDIDWFTVVVGVIVGFILISSSDILEK